MDAVGRSEKIRCSDGYELDAILYEPAGQTAGFVIFQGGTAIKKEFYTHFCRFLAEHGYLVLSYDYRGVGGSRPESLKGFEASLLDWGRLDMVAAIQYAVEKFPALPRILVGHSIGTQLIGFAANNNELKGVIGIGSSTGTWWKMKRRYAIAAFALWYLINPVLTRMYGYAPLKRLRIMEDLPKNVINQWSKWCRSAFYFGDHLGKTIPYEDFHPLRVPFIVHYFKDDPIATDETVTDLMALYRGTRTRMIKHRAKDYGMKKVGHFKVFSRQFSHSFWKYILLEIQRFSETGQSKAPAKGKLSSHHDLEQNKKSDKLR